MFLILFLCVLQNVAPYKGNSLQRHPYLGYVISDVAYDKYNWKPLKDIIDTLEVNNKPRRLFQWMKNIIKKDATTKTPKLPSYEDIVNEKIRFRQIERNLTATLTKLSHVLNQILNIVKYSRQENFEELHNLIPNKYLSKDVRNKRDITEKKNVDSDIKEVKAEGSEKTNWHRIKREINDTNKDTKKPGVEGSKTDDNKELVKNGRRVILPVKTITDNEIKNRLYKYIDEAFTEIATKIDSLRQTKQMLSQDANFRIGYIISNIDMLDVNMSNLKRDMDKNKLIWDDRKILNLYDTVRVTNTAINELLEILKFYIEKSLNS